MSNLVTAQEIKHIRGKYGLSQRDFALLLGIGPASIARYENGSKPTRALSNLIRAAYKPEFVFDCLNNFPGNLEIKMFSDTADVDDADVETEEKLSQATHDNIEKVVYSMLRLDEKGNVMSMTDIYEITLKQEVLNEQVANALAEIDRMILAAQKNGDEHLADFLEVIAHDMAVMKPTIATEETSTNEAQDKLRGKFEGLYHLAKYCNARVA